MSRLDDLEELLAKATPSEWWRDDSGSVAIYGDLGRCVYIGTLDEEAACEAIVALHNIAPALIEVARAAHELRRTVEYAYPQVRQVSGPVRDRFDAMADALDRLTEGDAGGR